MNLFKKDINLQRLERLQFVQTRIKELQKYTEIPKLRDFRTSTSTYPGDLQSAIQFIVEVMNGKRSPHVYSNKRGASYSESETFWSAFERYCHEMIEYCTNKEKNSSELTALKIEEEKLKRYLDIT